MYSLFLAKPVPAAQQPHLVTQPGWDTVLGRLFASPTAFRIHHRIFATGLLALPEQVRNHKPKASTAAPTRSIVASSKCLPITCTPIGNPSFVSPQGTLIPQIPARLAATE